MWNLNIVNDIKNRISKYETIGVFCSGGFDSSLLLYIVTNIIVNNFNDKKLIIYTVNRTDDSKLHSERILNHFSSMFNYKYEHVTGIGDPYTHHSKQVSSGIKEVFDLKVLLILGDTSNPNVTSLENGPERIKSHYDCVYQPFFDHDKTFTVSLAKDLNILDLISNISHTCTESKLLRCNICWQCRERSWAFDKLNLIDTGTM